MAAIFDANDVRAAANRLGSHFFDADAMRFFGSRLLSEFHALNADGSVGLIVTSEQPPYGPRFYSLRVYRVERGADGVDRFDIDSVVHEPTRAAAIRSARIYAERVKSGEIAAGTSYIQ